MKLVIDAFGGDNAPQAVIDGVAQALNNWDDFSVILTGDEARINSELAGLRAVRGSRSSTLRRSSPATNSRRPPSSARRIPPSWPL